VFLLDSGAKVAPTCASNQTVPELLHAQYFLCANFCVQSQVSCIAMCLCLALSKVLGDVVAQPLSAARNAGGFDAFKRLGYPRLFLFTLQKFRKCCWLLCAEVLGDQLWFSLRALAFGESRVSGARQRWQRATEFLHCKEIPTPHCGNMRKLAFSRLFSVLACFGQLPMPSFHVAAEIDDCVVSSAVFSNTQTQTTP